MSARVVLGLGSNLGDRLATLRLGVERLQALAGVAGVAVSPVYESPPLGPPQPPYLNAAVLLGWQGTPHALLDAGQRIEHDLGRKRAERWGPRTLDIDILWIEGVAVEDERLTVPHAELHARPFALVPLLDLVPYAADPRTGERYERPRDAALTLVVARL